MQLHLTGWSEDKLVTMELSMDLLVAIQVATQWQDGHVLPQTQLMLLQPNQFVLILVEME